MVLFIYFLVFGLISSSSHNNIKKKQFRFSSYDLFFLSIFSFGLFGFYFIYHFFFYTNPNIYIFISVWFIVGFAYLFRSGIKQVVHSYINNNEIIPIRLNIGKEKLSEEDILRLITYSLLDQYKKIKKPFSYFKRSVWTLSTGLFVYLVALSFYFNSNIYKLVNFWREQSHIVEYFPSQSFYKKTKENRESIFDYFNKGLYEDKNYKFLQKNDSLKISKDFHKNKEKDIIKSITHSIDYVYIHLLTSIVRPIDKLPIKSVSVNDIREKSKVKNNEKKEYTLKHNFLSDTFRINIEAFNFIPFYDYFFVIYIILFSFAANRILRSRILGINHHIIYKRLLALTENIDSKILENNGREIKLGVNRQFFNLNFFGKKNKIKEIPIAGEREIEIGLISILNDIESISSWRMRPRLIFILDELDKIQPKDNSENVKQDSNKYTETEWVKRRQDTIRQILTNLKHFFNTAKAKFIFIAGREMYDAALADISDRDALIGSMFHDIIYIPSFYKDPADGKVSDITSMTELYICQLLIPHGFITKHRNDNLKFDLRTYHLFLSENYKDLTELEKIKIIITLQNFISYVSYRSNGAPKKITRIFEEYLTSYPEDKTNFDSTIITRGDKRNIYLHFGYNDQYIFTVGKYLFNPFVMTVNKYISQFEDKLLVSTAFLLNHLYKFHKVGFSYKTLELTPEIIAIYKAPELRDFISRLIKFLKKTHIRKIISGLYDFKFYSVLESEISFVSKISEKESAALNFTLDESLIIKGIFRSKLSKLKKYWKSKRELNYDIDSITMLNANLGDLNFNDSQFLEAINYYKEALLPFKNIDRSKLFPDTIIAYIRVYLKLGLSFEMIRNYDQALLIYETIHHESLNFVKQCIAGKNWNKYQVPRQNPPLLVIQRMFYQALIAKLQIIEKSTIKSLTKNKLNANIKNFKNIVNLYLEPEQQFLLKGEYYNKIGDLLFFKNGILFGKNEDENPDEYSPDELEEFVKIQAEKKDKKHLYALPVSGYKYYMIGLATLINAGVEEQLKSYIKYFDIKDPENSEKRILHYLTDFLYRGSEKEFPLTRRAFYLAVANSLSDAGDSILVIASAAYKNKIDNNEEKNLAPPNILNTDIIKKVLKLEIKYKDNTSDDIKSIFDYSKDNEIHISNIYKNIINPSLPNSKNPIETIEIILNELSDLTQIFDDINCKTTHKEKLFLKHNCKHQYILVIPLKNIFDKLINHLQKIKDTIKTNQSKPNTTNIEWNTTTKEWNEIKKLRYNYEKEYNKVVAEFIKHKKTADNKLKNDINEQLDKLKDTISIWYKIDNILQQLKLDLSTEDFIKPYEEFDRLHIALRYFVISAAYFLKSEDYKGYIFQLKKFLHFFRVFIPVEKINNEHKAKLLDLIKEHIVERAIKFNFMTYSNYNKAEEEKLINSININLENEDYASIIHSATSASEDIKEVLILYQEIKLLLFRHENIAIKNNIIHPYISTSLEVNRLLELNYKNHYNYELLNQMYPGELPKIVIKKEEAIEVINTILMRGKAEELEFVILDSIFALFKMNKTIQIFGLSYTHNHSWRSSIYWRMAYWIELYIQFVNILEDDFNTKQKLQKLIGIVEMQDLSPRTYLEKALSHAYNIYSTHFEGEEYYDIISEMNYLDDDFNDSNHHFFAAIERVVINLGIIEQHIAAIKEKFIKNKNVNIQEYTVEYYVRD